MSPYELRILLHYYGCAGPYEDRGEPILGKTMDTFVDLGLLKKLPEQNQYGALYVKTDRLDCYIDYITKLPLPEWRMPT